MNRPAIPVRADLELMEGYHSPQVDVSVRLNTNESPFPPPAAWLDALRSELAGVPFHRYPDRRATALRRAIAHDHGVRPEQVFCANGSNEALQCLLLAFGGTDRTVATFEPTYALHTHIARLTGTPTVAGERNHDFTLDLGEVERVVAETRPAITFLCSPNNPTGLCETPSTVRSVLDLAPGLVVVDEAYGQFAAWSAMDILDASDRLVVVRTFSKTWSMAAARLGYLVASEPVVTSLESVALPYHLDSVKQLAGRLALQFKPEMHARVSMLKEERSRLFAALGDLDVETWPSEANFILFRPLRREAGEVWQRLLEHSVLVRDCSRWPRLAGCLRVTVGTQEENSAFLVALRKCLS
ncbi:MAG: histidinol-phosphate transaminase [Acidimicrobiales bacterium]